MNGGKLLPLFVLVCSLLSAQSASPEPILKSGGQPIYPPLARAAHIEGEVRLEFVLNRDGDPSSVTVVSGHPMLVPATVATVKTWKFEFPENAFQEGRKYETTFAYKVSKKDADNDSSCLQDGSRGVTFYNYDASTYRYDALIAVRYKFTGKERDSETGLDYFGARYYSNGLGRFGSPDWLDIPDSVPYADFDYPQSLNLYSYVRNSPLSNADPDGHDCVKQTRTSDKTETVTVTSGNCDNVKVGDGQTKTYVPGTVTSVQAGTDGRSIDIGYAPYEGGGTGVFTAPSAPIPDRPGLAYGYNAAGYRLLGKTAATDERWTHLCSVVRNVSVARGCWSLSRQYAVRNGTHNSGRRRWAWHGRQSSHQPNDWGDST